MFARIYRPAKTAMQSGKAKTHDWILEFEPASARVPDPLMGWSSSSDMNGQVRLRFPTKEEAVAYAQAHGIPFQVIEPKTGKRIIKPMPTISPPAAWSLGLTSRATAFSVRSSTG